MRHYSEAQIKSSTREQLSKIMSLSINNNWKNDIKRINEEFFIRFDFRTRSMDKE